MENQKAQAQLSIPLNAITSLTFSTKQCYPRRKSVQ